MMKITHYIYMLAAGLALGACNNDEPEIPAEELYLRNFIKTFGLIDPNQDWNLSQNSRVDVRLGTKAKKIVVYADVFDSYYRVARCYNVESGGLRIPLDIPVNTTDLAVDIDGEVYLTVPRGFVDATEPARSSRAADQPYLNEDDDLGWVIVAEDLGSTDDVDFNDIVVRMSYNETSYRLYGDLAPDQWDVFNQNTNDDLYLGDEWRSRGDGSRAPSAGKMEVKIQAAAAGGIKKIFLHYRDPKTNKDYTIGPDGSVETSTLTEYTANSYEWHYWFGHSSPKILNTYRSSTPIPGSATLFEVDEDFTFTQYSQLNYEHGNPKDVYNFDFSRRNIEGFYITVDTHTVAINGETAAYDLGKAIGHTRDVGLPPQMFIIPDLAPVRTGSTEKRHFRWATERTMITEAYTEFDTWVSTGATGWYKNATDGSVMTDTHVKTIYGER